MFPTTTKRFDLVRSTVGLKPQTYTQLLLNQKRVMVNGEEVDITCVEQTPGSS